MRLYATVSSEGASKGQEGNEYLEIEVKGENQETILELKIVPKADYYLLTGYAQAGGSLRSEHYIQYELRRGKKKASDARLAKKLAH
jgi:hypothetical protein